MRVRGDLGDFARRFRSLREQAGLTKTALASPRYTVSYLSQIEAGRRRPSPEALVWFAQRLGVSPSFLASGVPDGTEQELAFQVEHARVLLETSRDQEALEVLSRVQERAEDYGLQPLRARALALRGRALLSLRRLREAIDSYEEALESELLPERERGLAVAALARAYRAVGDLAYAADLVESYLRAHRADPLDPAARAELYTALVQVYFERGDIAKAEQASRRALGAAEEAGDPRVRANAYWDAARVLAEARRWEDALELVTRARLLLEEGNDRRRLGQLHTAHAFLCLEADPPRLGEAEDHLARAETLLEGAPGPDLAYLSSERSRLALMRGRPREALELAGRAAELSGTDDLERARALYLQGRALALLGSHAEAVAVLREAAVQFRKLGARQQEASCWRELGEVQLARGLVQEALESLREGLTALDPHRSRA